MSDESDIEMHSALPKKKTKNPPKSPTQEMLPKSQDNKKPSTKEMITQALTEMKSRKGISLYAIKKYIEEKYRVDVEKFNYLIKKSLKDGVEGGSIVQTKGMGASGSFRLAAKAKLEKKNKLDTKKKSKPPKTSTKKSEKVTKQKPTSKTEPKKKSENKSESKKVEKTKESATEKTVKKQAEKKEKQKKATKIAKGLQTPSKKKAAMMKRKSIGSIIKPPKMKPKAKA
ncbi:histone H1-like [Aricia agestis]|uniref:histone H1-like n=1 Tax=Aricia agestis TaxID=91739 RepID=UPI001C20B9C0|nr:histone H1-like [Aricia agestis]